MCSAAMNLLWKNVQRRAMVYNGSITAFTQRIINVVSVRIESADPLPVPLQRFQPQKLGSSSYLFRIERRYLKELVLLLEHNPFFTVQEPSLEDAILQLQSQEYKQHEVQ